MTPISSNAPRFSISNGKAVFAPQPSTTLDGYRQGAKDAAQANTLIDQFAQMSARVSSFEGTPADRNSAPDITAVLDQPSAEKDGTTFSGVVQREPDHSLGFLFNDSSAEFEQKGSKVENLHLQRSTEQGVEVLTQTIKTLDGNLLNKNTLTIDTAHNTMDFGSWKA